MSDNNTTQDFKDQITRAKILSEDLLSKLEQYSIVDCWGTYANAGATMETMVVARQIYDIIEDIYDIEVIDGFREQPDQSFRETNEYILRAATEGSLNLRDALKRKPGKDNA